MSDSVAQLEKEARYLHQAFFRTPPPAEVVERYVAANRLCLSDQDLSSERIISIIVARQLDAEAVELVLRLRRLNSVLTRKIQILFYLVEVRSSYYDYFVSVQQGCLHAWRRLLTGVLRTAWKFAKGTFLVRRYGLV